MKIVIALVLSSSVVALAIAWRFRYQTLESGKFQVVLLDRWTGEVYLPVPDKGLWDADKDALSWNRRHLMSLDFDPYKK